MNIAVGKIVLRDLREDDLPALKEIRDYSLEFLDTQVSYSLEDTIKWFNSDRYCPWYAIEMRDRLVGYIRTSNVSEVNKSLYVGLDLHPNFRGHGYAFQAYQTFLDWLKVQGYLQVYLKVQMRNYRAYNLYRKLEFNPVGIIPNAVILPSGKTVDSVYMYKSL